MLGLSAFINCPNCQNFRCVYFSELLQTCADPSYLQSVLLWHLTFPLTINSHIPETQKQNVRRCDQESAFLLAVWSIGLQTHLHNTRVGRWISGWMDEWMIQKVYLQREFKENLYVTLNDIRDNLRQGYPTSNHWETALYLRHRSANRIVINKHIFPIYRIKHPPWNKEIYETQVHKQEIFQ